MIISIIIIILWSSSGWRDTETARREWYDIAYKDTAWQRYNVRTVYRRARGIHLGARRYTHAYIAAVVHDAPCIIYYHN